MNAQVCKLRSPARDLAHVRRHFVLIETTATVLDESSGLVWSIRAMRLSFGADTVRTWLTERWARRSCLPEQVRFRIARKPRGKAAK